MRCLEQLINLEEPAWPDVQEWSKAVGRKVEFLPPKEPDRGDALVQCQVTTRSPMGAIVYESGGILVDDGWIRIFGSGHEKLSRSLPQYTLEATGNNVLSGQMSLIADDIVGGVFALDAGVLGNPGKVFFFQPDDLSWVDTGMTYSEFIYFCFAGDLDDFYGKLRWPGWRETHADFSGNRTICFVPPLCMQPFAVPRKKTVKDKIVGDIPVLESYGFLLDLAEQLEGVSGVVKFTVKD